MNNIGNMIVGGIEADGWYKVEVLWRGAYKYPQVSGSGVVELRVYRLDADGNVTGVVGSDRREQAISFGKDVAYRNFLIGGNATSYTQGAVDDFKIFECSEDITPLPTATMTATATFTHTNTYTYTHTFTETHTETNTYTSTNTPTETMTPTETPTVTPTETCANVANIHEDCVNPAVHYEFEGNLNDSGFANVGAWYSGNGLNYEAGIGGGLAAGGFNANKTAMVICPDAVRRANVNLEFKHKVNIAEAMANTGSLGKQNKLLYSRIDPIAPWGTNGDHIFSLTLNKDTETTMKYDLLINDIGELSVRGVDAAGWYKIEILWRGAHKYPQAGGAGEVEFRVYKIDGAGNVTGIVGYDRRQQAIDFGADNPSLYFLVGSDASAYTEGAIDDLKIYECSSLITPLPTATMTATTTFTHTNTNTYTHTFTETHTETNTYTSTNTATETPTLTATPVCANVANIHEDCVNPAVHYEFEGNLNDSGFANVGAWHSGNGLNYEAGIGGGLAAGGFNANKTAILICPDAIRRTNVNVEFLHKTEIDCANRENPLLYSRIDPDIDGEASLHYFRLVLEPGADGLMQYSLTLNGIGTMTVPGIDKGEWHKVEVKWRNAYKFPSQPGLGLVQLIVTRIDGNGVEMHRIGEITVNTPISFGKNIEPVIINIGGNASEYADGIIDDFRIYECSQFVGPAVNLANMK